WPSIDLHTLDRPRRDWLIPGSPACSVSTTMGAPKASGGDWPARFLLATRSVDRGFRLFDRLRSEMVLAVASDRTLDRFNDLAYASASDYDPESSSFRAYLFPWEERVVERFFPAPPARVLVGGAGSGREAFALVERGYEVTA